MFSDLRTSVILRRLLNAMDWASQYESDRGGRGNRLFSFLATPTNELVAGFHPNAMSLLLMDEAAVDWLEISGLPGDGRWRDRRCLRTTAIDS